LYPEQFKGISTEIIMNGKAEQSYNALRDSIIQVAKAKAAQAKLEERAAQRLERDEKINADIQEKADGG
jgi:tubulin-specific chaperone A